MHFELDGQGPLHAQLTRALKGAVLAGRLAAGAQLPPTRLLAAELSVSRNTVLTAYEQLHAEGFLQGRVGSGSYVIPPLQTASHVDAAPLPVAPQSAYARRARASALPYFRDRFEIPGKRENVRYNFQYGEPLTNPAVTTAWARTLAHAAAYTQPRYPAVQGMPELRAAVCDYLGRRRGVLVSADDVLIVAGTQQALTLTARVLIDEGDEVAIENPHYFAIREVLGVHGARLRTVAVDGDGLRCDLLPARAPKLICVTPSHQFPSGALMSLPRRLALLDYARSHGSWIFEDDYDGEFRYDSPPLAALCSLDQAGRVIYVGTFSKALFPSLRLGYLVMPAGLREDFVFAKWLDDLGSPLIEQIALADFMVNGDFERHLRRTGKELRRRRAALLDGLREHAGDRVEIADSHAGMHVVVWLRGRDTEQGRALIEHARTRGLRLYPITPYFIAPPDRAGLLMGFGGMSVTQISEAVVVFAQCLRETEAV